MIIDNSLSPIMFEVGPLELRWYGVLFASGLIVAYLINMWAFKKKGLKLENLDSLATYLFFGVVIGARLGEVLFYEPGYYFDNPAEIVKVWKGGLASHGATVGLFLTYLLWCKVKNFKFGKHIDAVALGIPVAAAFVRIGNFFNSEIVGKATGGDYGVIFNGESFARHPAQLYEGFWSLAVFAILLFVFKKWYKKMPEMSLMFLYIFLYFGGRFLIEFVKDVNTLPDSFVINNGQLLSLFPIVAALVYFAWYFPKQLKK
ncbi:prolipoprotein diacylglyceryl transferase [Candidatus Peregrinibacteria bacterium CG10_big_fil_rev_8_21_14_0_10_36_19]|nr:MAG: prolipoprotein diacylglyceryl transferase [Candidatus Peregrinibacteria bacterium CG10_big_fil_rev_8_21_14_0_10_36_19]